MKSGQVIEHNARNIFLQKPYRNEAGGLLETFFLFFKNALCEAKADGQHLRFNIFWH